MLVQRQRETDLNICIAQSASIIAYDQGTRESAGSDHADKNSAGCECSED